VHILYAASEMVPFVKTGGLADVAGALPAALAARGHRVTAVLPLYDGVNRAGLEPGEEFMVPVGTWQVAARPWRSRQKWGDVYLVEQSDYFARPHLYGPPGGEYADNPERFAFFSRAILALCRELRLAPDVLHVNDWQTALVPVYLREPDDGDGLEQSASVLTIHNLAFQGRFDVTAVNVLGLPPRVLGIDGLEYYGDMNYLKGGILYADQVTTVSPTYAREILEPQNGCGLDGVLRARSADLSGIENGIDTELWNPASDPHLAAPFSAARPEGRRANRRLVQRTLGLEEADAPLLGFVGRVTGQKGLDIVLDAMPALLDLGVQLALLGDGDPLLTRRLVEAARFRPGRVGVATGFDEPLARNIYGGSDLFLMPSRFEPCGLAQLIAMRYGAPPVVHRVGGLADTVVAWNDNPDSATGFAFDRPDTAALLAAVAGALEVWKEHKLFARIQRNGMQRDSSWQARASACEAVYEKALEARRTRKIGGALKQAASPRPHGRG